MLRTVVTGARSLVVGSLVVVGFVAAPTVGAVGASTSVDAVICGSAATITMEHPASDSTVEQSSVTVDGVVTQATQIEIYVDDALDHVLSLEPTQTSYSTTVNLTEGTHTIKAVAVDRCHVSNSDASSVVTYVPPQSGSGGDETPGTVSETPSSSSQPGSSGVTILPPGTGSSSPEQSAGGGNGSGAFKELIRWLNIDTPGARVGMGSISSNTLRLAVMAAGFTLLVFGTACFSAKVAATSMFMKVPPGRRALIAHIVIRLTGALLFLAAFYV